VAGVVVGDKEDLPRRVADPFRSAAGQSHWESPDRFLDRCVRLPSIQLSDELPPQNVLVHDPSFVPITAPVVGRLPQSTPSFLENSPTRAVVGPLVPGDLGPLLRLPPRRAWIVRGEFMLH